MNVQEQIDRYISDQPPSKGDDINRLHDIILRISPDCELTFSDGRNGDNKIVSNPTIGYGRQTSRYASGATKEFFQVGVSGNSTGISVYILGLADKNYLSKSYGSALGKATITGYCIRFRHLNDINIGILKEIVANHMGSGLARGS